MKFNLTSPCADCPFRTDIAFYLRKSRRQGIADALLHDETFACHKTVRQRKVEEQHCGGALGVLAKSGHLFDNWRLRFAAMLGLFKPDKLKFDAPVFETMQDFVDAEE